MLTDSRLGFGLMRLPKDAEDRIDIDRVSTMVDAYLDNGFTYFDTAYVYKGSEAAIKEALVKRHPRDSYTLANKLPKWEIESIADAQRIFETSLKRCGVEYFDYYLLHSLNEEYYQGCVDLKLFDFVAQKKAEGKVKHVGFSYHDGPQLLDRILTEHPEMEFVQLQINYLDWDSKIIFSKENYDVARKHGKPVIVMEPVKGGTLAQLPQEIEQTFKALRPESSIASWALRFVASLDGIMTILSGMSTQEQMADNLKTMSDFEPMTSVEFALVDEVVHQFLAMETIACTSCRYCIKGCPMNILIPDVFTAFNSSKMYGKTSRPKAFYEKHTQGEHGLASACIECGQCESVCPQHLPIIHLLKDVAKTFETV